MADKKNYEAWIRFSLTDQSGMGRRREIGEMEEKEGINGKIEFIRSKSSSFCVGFAIELVQIVTELEEARVVSEMVKGLVHHLPLEFGELAHPFARSASRSRGRRRNPVPGAGVFFKSDKGANFVITERALEVNYSGIVTVLEFVKMRLNA